MKLGDVVRVDVYGAGGDVGALGFVTEVLTVMCRVAFCSGPRKGRVVLVPVSHLARVVAPAGTRVRLECQECGKRFTRSLAAAERSESECPKCGGCDCEVL